MAEPQQGNQRHEQALHSHHKSAAPTPHHILHLVRLSLLSSAIIQNWNPLAPALCLQSPNQTSWSASSCLIPTLRPISLGRWCRALRPRPPIGGQPEGEVLTGDTNAALTSERVGLARTGRDMSHPNRPVGLGYIRLQRLGASFPAKLVAGAPDTGHSSDGASRRPFPEIPIRVRPYFWPSPTRPDILYDDHKRLV